jgi:small subunit ribosomal protein S17
MEPKESGTRKKMVGVVVKDKMDKTVVIETERLTKHPKYHKYQQRKKRYKAHDEENRCKVGDKVMIIETGPISKDKRWLVKDIIKKEEPALVLEQEEVDGNDTGTI